MNNFGKYIVLVNIENDTPKVRQQLSPPFGLLIAASVLQRNNVNVIVRHIINTKESLKELLTISKDAIAVGFSTMTSQNLLSAIEASHMLHNLGIYVFWGGPHATLLPEIVLKDLSIDAVLRGEAEANLYEFYKWRTGEIKDDEVPGLCHKGNDGIIKIRPIPPLVDANSLGYHPFELLNINKYLDKPIPLHKNFIPGNVIPIMTSKGCVKRCAFCYNTVVNKSKWRPYDIERVFYEMDYLVSTYNITGWLFYDDNLFIDSERAFEIIERYKMPSSVEIDLNRVTPLFLERAKKANISKVYIGIESGSDSMLKRMHKGISKEMVREKAKLIGEFELNVDFSFMIMLPHESDSELIETFDLIHELETYPYIKIDGPKCYNPYPGTEFYLQLVNSGWEPPGSNEEWAKFVRKISPLETGLSISERKLEILKKEHII